jgi:hypothetical protein
MQAVQLNEFDPAAVERCDALLDQVAEQPWRLRHLRPSLNKALNRHARARVGDACLDYYERHRATTAPQGRLLAESHDLDWVADEIEIVPETRIERDAPLCLTVERPTALFEQGYLAGKHNRTNCWIGKPGNFSIRFTHDLPVVIREAGVDKTILTAVSSPNADGINIKGGSQAYRERPFKTGPIAITFDEFVGNNYCHWLLDWLPRIVLLKREGVDLAGYNFVFSRPIPAFIRETLQAIGISEANTIQFNSREQDIVSSVCTDRLIAISSCGRDYRHAINGGDPRYLAAIREALRLRRPSGKRNIFINRTQSRRLYVDNIGRNILERAGFVEVFLEKLSFQDQIALFAEAGSIISAHGAGLANLIFCEAGTKVLELFPSGYSTSAYAMISHANGLDYACAVAPRHGDPHRGHIRDDDLFCSSRLVTDWLQS